MSFFLLALLIIILPIFIVTILFKQTIYFFDNWLEQFIGSCVMLIVITATVALMLSLIITQLQDMLYYTVCWDTIFSWKPLGITIIYFKFWKASSWDEFTKAVTPKNFFYVLISCVLFIVYIDYVPTLVDALGGVAKKPLSGIYMGGDYDKFMEDPTRNSPPGLTQSFDGFMKHNSYIQAFNKNILSPIKQRMGLLHYVDRASHNAFGTKKDSIIKEGMEAVEKSNKFVTDKWSSFTGDPQGELGVYDVKKEEGKVYEKLKDLRAKGQDFTEAFGKLKQALKDRKVRKGEEKSRDLMKKMLDEDKGFLDKSVENLDARYQQLITQKDAVLDSKQLLEGKLDEIERGQNKLNQSEAEFDQARRSLDDIQRKDDELMALKDQRDPLNVKDVEESYQKLLQEKYGNQERILAEKQQQIEQDRSLLEQKRENYTQQLETHQQNVEDYQRSVSEFEEDRRLVQEQYELYEEQQRVLEGGISQYEIENNLNRTYEEMEQTVDLFQNRQQELSTSQAQLEEQLRQLDELNKQLEQQRELSEQLAQEIQNKKDEPLGDQDQGERLRLNDALEKRYAEQQVQIEQLQAELDQGRETYSQEYEYQAQKYDQYSQDMARDQDELANTQYAYEQQKSEYESFSQSSIEGRWD
jgi:chromosome segregation ATPase